MMIVAELCNNFHAKEKVALFMTAAASEAGATHVKTQLRWRDDRLSAEGHKNVRREAERLGMGWFASVFDQRGVDFLREQGSETIKIPSGELTNHGLLKAATLTDSSKETHIVLATGMSEWEEVKAAMNALVSARPPPGPVTICQCTSAYPTPTGAVNLNVLELYRRCYPSAYIGLSCHTDTPYTAYAAVALGCTYIEKHLTLNRDQEGPDHKASLEPEQFAQMVEGIRNISPAMGSSMKRIQACELDKIEEHKHHD